MREGFRLVQTNAYKYEDTIVWLVPLKDITVIEKIVVSRSRTRKPRECAGYTTLFAETPNNGKSSQFFRRIFIADPNGIDPDKVLPGVCLTKPESVV
jgi:hypothetical protein